MKGIKDINTSDSENLARMNFYLSSDFSSSSVDLFFVNPRHSHASSSNVQVVELNNDIIIQDPELKNNIYGQICNIKINILPTKTLKTPLDAIIESDDSGFIARAIDLPLYGYGDDRIEAMDNLKIEIETLYNDLMEDDEFTDEWLLIKRFLMDRILD